MNYTNRTVLVVGMARSGMAAAKALLKIGARVIVNDQRTQDRFDNLDQIAGAQFAFGVDPVTLLADIDCMVISPGVPIDSPFVLAAKEKNIPVIGEIELAYTLCQSPVLAITGTNGKTTTTALVGEIFRDAGRKGHTVGNIGIPYIEYALEATPEETMIAEISSFQLESVDQFKPYAAAVLNLSSDHLNRHYTMECYADTKKHIFQRQTEADYAVLNWDNEYTRAMGEGLQSRIIYFSRLAVMPGGVYVDGEGYIVSELNGEAERIIHKDRIYIPGAHNLENALAAVALSLLSGIDAASIAYTLEHFAGVEHRIEFVREHDGIRYINDSKGTNPDSSIKAVQSMTRPTCLIAGGYDKGSDFTEFIESFTDEIVHMVVIGATAQRLADTAAKCGYTHVSHASSLEEAICMAADRLPEGGNVLLSPACASFDMFSDYEQRGREFKRIVNSFGKED